MKFTVISTFLTAAAFANAAVLAPRQSVDCATEARGVVYERPFVRPLIDACTSSIQTPENPWTSKVCVAAAVAAGPRALRNMLTCKAPTLGPETAMPNLDYNVYASIVGDCAWAPNGCDVTRQNLVDLVYSGISAEQNPVWPGSADELVRYYIDPIFRWTATSPTNTSTPYTNFNDWLHFVGPVAHCTEQSHTGCPPGEPNTR